MKMRTDNMIGRCRTGIRPGMRGGGNFIRGALLAIGLSLIGGAAAQTSKSDAAKTDAHEHSSSKFPIPQAIQVEHAEIHEQLVAATKVPGKVGEAARKLAAVLHPHFEREEQIALPPLALLGPLSRGEFKPDMREVLAMTDALRAELPRMLEEHKAIEAATAQMGAVAKEESNAAVARLAETLAVHARSEEQVFYPAALLVGDIVRARAEAKTAEP